MLEALNAGSSKNENNGEATKEKSHLKKLEEDEVNSDSVVSLSSNVSNGFSNLSHTSTPISSKGAKLPNLFNAQNLRKTVAFKLLGKEKQNQIDLPKNWKDCGNHLVKEFSANGFLDVSQADYHQSDLFTFWKKNFGLGNLNLFENNSFIVLVTIILSIIGYEMVVITVTFTNSETLSELSEYTQEKFNGVVAWILTPEVKSILNPIICGLAVSIFSFFMVYFDSSLPGVYPPSPFSPRSKQIYSSQRTSAIQLSYLMALASGIIVTIFMYFEVY